MRITITDGTQVASLDIDPSEKLEDVNALIEVEFGIPSENQVLYFQNKLLQNNNPIASYGIKQDSLILVQTSEKKKTNMSIQDIIKNAAKNMQQPPQNNTSNMLQQRRDVYLKKAKELKKQIAENGANFAEHLQSNHQFSDAVFNEDPNVLANYLMKRDDQLIKKKKQQQQKFLTLSKNQFDPQYQKLVEEGIHKTNIDSNLEYAQQFIPQVFGRVQMLYIRASINKVPIQAFVDSGAQSTIMSVSCAEKCGVMRLVDKRYAGIAVGVGNCKILGRVHAAEIMIQGQFITCSLTVIENNGIDFLLGLDMLKRFNCVIDLKKNVLSFQDGQIVTKFLSEGEIQKKKQIKPEPNKSQIPQKPLIKQEVIKPEPPKPAVQNNSNEQKLKRLQNLGFGRQQSMQALRAANGNEEVAAAILTQKRFGF